MHVTAARANSGVNVPFVAFPFSFLPPAPPAANSCSSEELSRLEPLFGALRPESFLCKFECLTHHPQKGTYFVFVLQYHLEALADFGLINTWLFLKIAVFKAFP